MVKICNNNSYNNNEKYKEHFNKFSFELSDFQKHSIEAIVDGHHSLVCCPTGSGKTLPAEFAIDYFTSIGKRVIYTSPLKALSNEKYYDFTKKYPNISFGILTGDIKYNPEAQVLIMTAEILLNVLFSKNNNKSLLSFEMDFDNDLGCVIMDEIHYINDEGRGNTWEQTLMILPLHIQLIMLSATLDGPENFANWIENRDSNKEKQVYLSLSDTRIVPLTHYSFITTNQGFFKQIKNDEVLTKEIKDLINKPILIKTANGKFNEINYYKIKKILNLFQTKNTFIKKQHVINEVLGYLFQNNMLPAVLFVLSKKQIHIIAEEITTILLEDDSKIPYIIHKECDDILRKLPNYEDYKQLPEYVKTVSLLEKGIGIHHSGVIPILREMTEILFSKGYIKLLLATETFSVGLNMPIKTTIFTNLSKFDGNENRYFYSHEYMQTSGRAGRRGIDKIGTVIHLNNLFKPIELTEYMKIMSGKPQLLVSKFKISYNLLLNLIENKTDNILNFVEKSMIQNIIKSNMNNLQTQIDNKNNELIVKKSLLLNSNIPENIIERYIFVIEAKKTAINKKRKELEREFQSIKDEWKFIDNEKDKYISYKQTKNELEDLEKQYEYTINYLNINITKVLNLLEKELFINNSELTTMGFIASKLKEVHNLVFASLIYNGELNTLTSKELVQLFSCFTSIVVSDEVKTISTNKLNNIIKNINLQYEKYQDFESDNRIDTNIDYNIHYDLIDYIDKWYDASSSEECKYILQTIEKEKEIFLGEFVKAILKIIMISTEMESIAENIGNIELLQKLKNIPINMLKFVVSNQSLYL